MVNVGALLVGMLFGFLAQVATFSNYKAL